jgi:rubrerythrin
MPDFGSSLAGLGSDRKMTNEELVRAVRFAVAAEYEAGQLYMQIAEATENGLARAVMKEVADEESVHAGELNRKSPGCYQYGAFFPYIL